jgi:hypothetical protein
MEHSLQGALKCHWIYSSRLHAALVTKSIVGSRVRVGSKSQDIVDSGGIDPEEIYHNDCHLYVLALRRLALEPDAQCRAEGDYNVAQELQHEIIVGRCLIGKGKLSAVEEKAIGDLAAAASALPKDALLFANGHAPNVEVMRNLAWAPLRIAAANLIPLLEPRAEENRAYFEGHKLAP